MECAARRCGIPPAWADAEARENRLPAVRIGKRLFTSEAVLREALEQRARAGAPTEAAR